MRTSAEQPRNLDQPGKLLTHHRREIGPLTGIRFIAAMQAVVYHFGSSFAAQAGAPAPIVRMLSNGDQAIPLFFILSGFILTYTYTTQMQAHGAVLRFWQARFARLYPVYVLALVACSLVFMNLPSLRTALQCLFLVQAWQPYHHIAAYDWNFPAWTLSVEAMFYAGFPLLLAAVVRLGKRGQQVALLLLLALIVFGHTFVTPGIAPQDLNALKRWLPVAIIRLPEFALGIVLGTIFLRDRVRATNLWLLHFGAIGTVLCLMYGPPHWMELLAVSYAALLYQLACGGSWLGRILGSRIFLLLGGASYSVYLLQLPVRHLSGLIWAGAGRHAQLAAAISSPILLVGVAITVFLFWEEPARRWLRGFFSRMDTSMLASKRAAG